MDKKLSDLITQILKENTIKCKIDNKTSKKSEKKDVTKINKNIVDILKTIVKDFSEKENPKKDTSEYLSLPDSYKLNVSYGNDNFEGHYKNITNKYRKYKNTKTLSYSTMAAEINNENKNNAITIIQDKKENRSDSFLFDNDKKMAVESYKWQSIAWWHLLYELEGKIIF